MGELKRRKFKIGDKVRYSFRTEAGSHRHGNGVILDLSSNWKSYLVQTPHRVKWILETELRHEK